MLTIEYVKRKDREWRTIERNQHRLRAPALTSYWDNGTKLRVIFYENNVIHRDYKLGPASMDWDSRGQLARHYYIDRGEYHRPKENGPAITHWRSNGEICCQSYLEHGR